MAPRASTAAAASSALDNLSPAELKAVKANLFTAQFKWAPETFAKGGMDLANTTMYAATRIVDESLQQLAVPPAEGEERPFTLEEDHIQKGIYRLETLLETSIDKHFDLFEIFVLRNTFTVQTDLIPYIALPHQEHIDESLKGKDEEAINEYEEELRLYEEELQKARELACAEEFVKRKVESVQEKAQEVGYMGGADPLSSRTQGLVLQLTLLQERLATLLETPSPPTQGPPPTEAEPWTSRAAFVNWAASAKVDALPAVPRESGSGTASEDVVITQLQENMERTGKQEDATSLLDSL
ncbi:Mis12 protein-domain-containing protein [Leucosporidium creatinivorum]|uniref:Mis12 protein-domain-containing protein n=1 Tax=Leucosporidium creatinivorum TaxID=106004 RepID=A0A1Y2FV98_9BASI|nr:Mis12 protein-domain-containing protein [Leucosporidium creatinivorum]